MKRGILLAMTAATLTQSACRDVSEPFRPVERVPHEDPATIRLTYQVGDDRAPLWSADGDSIYYTASFWEETPFSAGTIVSIPANGAGPSRQLLRNVQAGNARENWLTAAALRPGTDQIAFIRILPLLPPFPCEAARVCELPSDLPIVQLQGAELHTRLIDDIGGLPDDVFLPLELRGYSLEFDPTVPGGMLTVSEYHPFQLQFQAHRRAFFRPSWSPDAPELVVSDGLRLLRWTVGSGTTVEIPGTTDAIMPAWSPDGEWIAFARYQRVASETFRCDYMFEDASRCAERRTIHYAAPAMIGIVRPDGSDAQELMPGTDPAWSPDNRFIVAASADSLGLITRIEIATGIIDSIPGTAGGIEPAVSPDGTRLAFSARDSVLSTRDIHVVELP